MLIKKLFYYRGFKVGWIFAQSIFTEHSEMEQWAIDAIDLLYKTEVEQTE